MVLGVARSATTWLATTLAAATGGVYIDEPDGHAKHPAALVAKAGLGMFPTDTSVDERLLDLWVTVSDPSTAAAGHPLIPAMQRRLWRMTPGPAKDHAVKRRRRPNAAHHICRMAFGQLPAPCPPADVAGPVILKSVHACLYADSLARSLPLARFVVTRRDITEVTASWLRLGYYPFGDDQKSDLERAAAAAGISLPISDNSVAALVSTVGLQQVALQHVARRRGWFVFDHGRATDDPEAEFGATINALGLSASTDLASLLSRSASSGGTYETRRTPVEAHQWRRGLTAEQQDELEYEVSRFTTDLGSRP